MIRTQALPAIWTTNGRMQSSTAAPIRTASFCWRVASEKRVTSLDRPHARRAAPAA